MNQPSANPGWYPDPRVPGQQRFWNGQVWTDQVAPLGAPPVPPAAPPIQPPGVPTPGAPAPAPEDKKNWFLRHKILTAVIALVLLGVVGAALSGGDDTTTTASEDTSASPKADDTAGDESPASSDSATQEAKPEKTKEPKPEPVTYGDGTYEVGKDIPRGTYRSSEDTQLCYWATLKGFGGELDDIIKNGNNSPAIVELNRGTKGFEANGCGDWTAIEDTFPKKPATSFGDGTYVVGKDIKPGRYRADGKASDLCYWARLSSFSGGPIDGIIANGNSPTILEIQPGDTGFETFGCGKWS